MIIGSKHAKSPLKDSTSRASDRDREQALDTRGIDSYRQDCENIKSKELNIDVSQSAVIASTDNSSSKINQATLKDHHTPQPLLQSQPKLNTGSQKIQASLIDAVMPTTVTVRSSTLPAEGQRSMQDHHQLHPQSHQPQPSPLSSNSAATTINIQANTPRAPVLSASDAPNSNSFIRGVNVLSLNHSIITKNLTNHILFSSQKKKNFLSSTISGSDLNRYLNSGYIHSGDSYLNKGTDLKYPKSPHFHRPPNFSFYRNVGPNYVTPQRSSNRGLFNF